MIKDLQKDYHILDLQERIMREIVLHIELLLNNKRKDISEYQIQEIILNFLHNNLDKSIFTVTKEKFGKYDIVIEKNDKPLLLFELKTFVKDKEKLQTNNNYKYIKKDCEKLLKGIEKYKCRAYFLLVCKERDLKENKKEFKFVIDRLDNIRKWVVVDNIKLRPSRKDKCYNTFAFSWEIKGKK